MKNEKENVTTPQFLEDWAKRCGNSVEQMKLVYTAMRMTLKGYVNEGKTVDLSSFLHLEPKESPKRRTYFNFYEGKEDVKDYSDRPFAYKARLAPYLKYPEVKEK